MSTEYSTAVWLRPEPGRRRTRFSRDMIAVAAVRIADAEGIDAVSMRRVAAELGAGTMSLYHYVGTKAELFTLLTDAVIGENLVPADELPSSWRAALLAIAHRTRAALNRHPWVFDVVDQPTIGPNGIRHFEQSLQAVAELGLDIAQQLDIISMVDEYVFGFCLRERELVRRGQPNAHGGDAEGLRDLIDYISETVREGDFPCLSRLLEGDDIESVWMQIEAHMSNAHRFERNLDLLLDGIERGIVGG